jgi:Flagellar biosynthesis protein, FliO
MKPRLALVLLIGAFAFLTPRITAAQDLAEHNDAAVIGRLPLDTKLHPTLAAAHPLALDNAGTGKLAIYFVTLAGLVVGGYFLLKRGLPLRAVRGSESRLHLRETKMLGNRQFLVVAEYEGSRILLGVGPGRIEYLCPLDSAEEPADSLSSSRDLK